MTTTTLTDCAIGSPAPCSTHEVSVLILDVESAWNHTVYQVLVPRLATVEECPAESLSRAQPTIPAPRPKKLIRERDNVLEGRSELQG